MYRILITLILSISTTVLFAQNYTANADASKVIITGTSTVHDWESEAEEFSGEASIDIEDGLLVSITDLKFSVVVNSIKSGKSGMDKKIYEALNPKRYPSIVFELIEVAEVDENSLVANGILTISGVTNNIRMEVNYEVLPDGAVSFKGTQSIKMTDYKIDPPTAVFGTIKAGDEVKVAFNMTMDCPQQLACTDKSQ